MKKASIVLIIITLVFASFLGGFLLGRNMDGSKVTVSRLGTTTPPASTESTASSTTIVSDHIPIDLNTATAEDLAQLPSIGEVLAQRIVDYRQAHGPFHSLDELTNVEGIGEKRLADLSEYLTIGG